MVLAAAAGAGGAFPGAPAFGFVGVAFAVGTPAGLRRGVLGVGLNAVFVAAGEAGFLVGVEAEVHGVLFWGRGVKKTGLVICKSWREGGL